MKTLCKDAGGCRTTGRLPGSGDRPPRRGARCVLTGRKRLARDRCDVTPEDLHKALDFAGRLYLAAHGARGPILDASALMRAVRTIEERAEKRAKGGTQ